MIGAGTYADDRIGAGSATGPGEAIIRIGLVRSALDLLAHGVAVEVAAQRALEVLRERIGVPAGLILLDAHGRPGIAHTTPGMAAAWIAGEGGTTVL